MILWKPLRQSRSDFLEVSAEIKHPSSPPFTSMTEGTSAENQKWKKILLSETTPSYMMKYKDSI
jgi:hypothetical protein